MDTIIACLLLCVNDNGVQVDLPPVHANVQIQPHPKVDASVDKPQSVVPKVVQPQQPQTQPQEPQNKAPAPQQHNSGTTTQQQKQTAPEPRRMTHKTYVVPSPTATPKRATPKKRVNKANKHNPKKHQRVKIKVVKVPVVVHDTRTVTKTVAAGIASAVLFVLGLLAFVLVWLGYLIGFKDAERKDTNFMRALRDTIRKK